MIKFKYPGSRISSSGQCKLCRGTYGDLINHGLLTLTGSDGKEVRLMRISCNYCGYTMLFDVSVVENTPYRGEGEEIIPDFNRIGSLRDM